MTAENLVTVPVGTTLEEAKELLHRHRIEKLPVVDDEFRLKGLITVKDIQKQIQLSPGMQGRVRPAARRGCSGHRQRHVWTAPQLLLIDSHGRPAGRRHGPRSQFRERAEDGRCSDCASVFPETQLVAGNMWPPGIRGPGADRTWRRRGQGRRGTGQHLHHADRDRRRRAPADGDHRGQEASCLPRGRCAADR